MSQNTAEHSSQQRHHSESPDSSGLPTGSQPGSFTHSAEHSSAEGDWHTGTVKWFNDAKGFGFIIDARVGDVFVHYSVIETEGFRTLKEGEEVRYLVRVGEKGNQASIVQRASGEGSKNKLSSHAGGEEHRVEEHHGSDKHNGSDKHSGSGSHCDKAVAGNTDASGSSHGSASIHEDSIHKDCRHKTPTHKDSVRKESVHTRVETLPNNSQRNNS